MTGSVVGAAKTTAVDDIVSGPASSVANRVAVFSGTTGKILADGGTTLSQYLLLSGGTMSGAILMGANNVTGATSVLTTNVDANSAVTLNLGTATASAVTLGKAGGTNTLTGNTTMSQAYAYWVFSSSTVTSYTSGTRLALTFANSSIFTNEFTLSTVTGIMTYTGTRTRLVRISANISLKLPSSGSSMTHWVSKNPASPAAAPTQSRVVMDLSALNYSAVVPIAWSDMISVSTNDTLQLCGLVDFTGSVTYREVSLMITGLFN
jgi:hypothetical protein